MQCLVIKRYSFWLFLKVIQAYASSMVPENVFK